MNITARFLLGSFMIASSFNAFADTVKDEGSNILSANSVDNTSSAVSMLDQSSGASPAENLRSYEKGYYNNEGALLFKFRPFYSNASGKMSNIPAPNNGIRAPKSLTTGGYGFDSAATYFLGQNIATELSLGIGYYSIKKSALTQAQQAYGIDTSSTKKSNSVWMVPFAGTLQYHIAPYGAIRPYLGAGGHGTYTYTKSNEFRVNNGYGIVLQAGVDLISKDDTLITLDVRHFTMKSKIDLLQKSSNSPTEFSNRVKWNPTIISLGFGFVF